MTHRCHVCQQLAELPTYGPLCTTCAEVAVEFDLRLMHRRIRIALARGDHDEHRRLHRRMIHRLRTFGEADLEVPE